MNMVVGSPGRWWCQEDGDYATTNDDAKNNKSENGNNDMVTMEKMMQKMMVKTKCPSQKSTTVTTHHINEGLFMQLSQRSVLRCLVTHFLYIEVLLHGNIHDQV